MFSAHSYYQQDIQGINLTALPWDRLRGKRILLAGATGLIGTFLVDTLFYLNTTRQLDVTVYAIGRDEKTARERFKDIWEDSHFSFYTWDVTQPAEFPEKVDYVIHGACDTQPTRILAHPVETIMANITGTEHLLEVARDCGAERFLFLSSGSIYGQPWRPDDRADEKYQGGLDCNSVGAVYAESKRAGETLTKAWHMQYGIDVVIARLAHVYGVTMRTDDTKPFSKMLLDCARKKDIVLHGGGNQQISCCYVADAVSGLLYVLLGGKSGSAYNIAGSSGKARSLKDLANYLAKIAGRRVIFDLPDREEQMGSVLYTTAALDTHRLTELGWYRKNDLSAGIMRTVCMLQENGIGEADAAEKESDSSPWESDGSKEGDGNNSLLGFFRRKR